MFPDLLCSLFENDETCLHGPYNLGTSYQKSICSTEQLRTQNREFPGRPNPGELLNPIASNTLGIKKHGGGLLPPSRAASSTATPSRLNRVAVSNYCRLSATRLRLALAPD